MVTQGTVTLRDAPWGHGGADVVSPVRFRSGPRAPQSPAYGSETWQSAAVSPHGRDIAGQRREQESGAPLDARYIFLFHPSSSWAWPSTRMRCSGVNALSTSSSGCAMCTPFPVAVPADVYHTTSLSCEAMADRGGRGAPFIVRARHPAPRRSTSATTAVSAWSKPIRSVGWAKDT